MRNRRGISRRRQIEREQREGERVFDGLGVSPGIAIGPAHIRESGAVEVPEYCLAPAHVEEERDRFRDAVRRSRQQLEKVKAKSAVLPDAAAEEIGYLLDAHLHMLMGSRLVRRVEERIVGHRINAEAAVQAEMTEIAKGFSAMDDAYLASRMDDIREVGYRLVRNLTKTPYRPMSTAPANSVIIAEELTPADTALLDPRQTAGFATVLGGAEGHTAIMARALGLPAVLGVPGIIGAIEPNETVILDGTAGTVIVDPTPETLAEYERRRRELRRQTRQLARLRRLPAVTRDGVEVTLQANVELPLELDVTRDVGAWGIGLLRTEFLFMNREDLPDEEEQYAALRLIVERMEGRPVTVRTLDVGGEKLADPLRGHVISPTNPALGLRAIRLSLHMRKLFETQLAATLRAGAHGHVRILLPLISTVAEVRQVRDILRRVAQRLGRRGVRIADPLPPVGAMIETPGAALAADALAQTCDFFALGTNDLTMYTLAIDRADEQVAQLYNPLHPAVLRLMQFTAEAALRARIPVSACGEIAGDPRYTALLLGLGIRDLSMAPAALPRVKQRVRSLDLMAATQRVQAIMDQWDAGRIAVLLDDFNALA